jgi:hypothetical protein
MGFCAKPPTQLGIDRYTPGWPSVRIDLSRPIEIKRRVVAQGERATARGDARQQTSPAQAKPDLGSSVRIFFHQSEARATASLPRVVRTMGTRRRWRAARGSGWLTVASSAELVPTCRARGCEQKAPTSFSPPCETPGSFHDSGEEMVEEIEAVAEL